MSSSGRRGSRTHVEPAGAILVVRAYSTELSTMTLPTHLVPALRDLVHTLVVGDYDALHSDGRAGRLSADELRQAISRYGRRLVDPPDAAFRSANAYAIEGSQHSWAVDLDLWTAEEGHSDLTLSVTAEETADGIWLTIDDLHVL